MNSMTGYGKCVLSRADRQVTVEMKSVNNRYLEINCRIPKVLAFLEEEVKRVIKKNLSRGTVDVFFNYENNSDAGKEVSVDGALAKKYVDVAKTLAKNYGLKNNFAVSELMKTPDVLKIDATAEDEDLLKEIVRECTEGAVMEMIKMRKVEGETVKADLDKLIGNVETALAKAEQRAPKVVTEYAEKIKARVSEILGEVEVDENKLLNEVAFFADKADINEEISRLHSHIVQFKKALTEGGPQGRNLDFISQEVGREINTMGSKSNDAELTSLVIYMKNELEKIKEQIRNVE